MISYFILNFLRSHDSEIDISLSVDTALYSAFSETILFILWSFYTNSDKQAEIIFISAVAAIYINLTVIIDYHTGFVYKIINVIVLIIFLSINFHINSITFSCVISVLFLLIFLVICDKTEAFGRGDSEFIFVTFWMLCLGIDNEAVLETTLGILFLSSFLFGIYRKADGRKEGMIPYTPFIVVSECIFIIISCLSE